MAARVRIVTTGVAVSLALTLAACGGGSKPKATKTPVCPVALPAPTQKISVTLIYLNVYNASSKDGLAGSVASELTWRGMKTLKTGNDPNPDGRPVPKAAEIRYGPSGKQLALTLAQQVQNAVLYDDGRTNPTLDLVLGDQFALVPLPPPAPSKITLNVYNTTYRSGLATTVAGDLKKRGFHIDKAGNDPNGQFLPDDVAIIRYGDHGEPAARRVALQLKGARLVKDGRTDTTVDVVLGNKYTELVPVAQATPTPTPSASKPAGC